MRPERLNPLFATSASLKGVGAGVMRPLEKLGLTRVRDLAYHLPDRFVQRRAVTSLDEASVGEQIVVRLTPREYRASGSPRAPFRVHAEDAAGNICALTYFGRNGAWAKKQLPLGEPRWVADALLMELWATPGAAQAALAPSVAALRDAALASGRRAGLLQGAQLALASGVTPHFAKSFPHLVSRSEAAKHLDLDAMERDAATTMEALRQHGLMYAGASHVRDLARMEKQLRLLNVRKRWVDVVCLGLLGAGIVTLSLVVPPQP